MKNLEMNQKGIAQILVILLLLAGLGAGAYLVQRPTNFLPKAYTGKQPVSAPVTPKPTKSPNPTAGEGKVNICHATSSGKNPYVLISINKNALGEHVTHGDVYPVPESGCPK